MVLINGSMLMPMHHHVNVIILSSSTPIFPIRQESILRRQRCQGIPALRFVLLRKLYHGASIFSAQELRLRERPKNVYHVTGSGGDMELEPAYLWNM